MGSAIWEFMWCLDKITRIDEDGLGWVLGGRPIKVEEIVSGFVRKDGEKIVGLGGHSNTIERNLRRLEKNGYIKFERSSYGRAILVQKAQKRWTQNGASRSTQNGASTPKNGESHIYDNAESTSKDSAPTGADSTSLKKPYWRKDNRESMNLQKFKNYWSTSPARYMKVLIEYAEAKNPDCQTVGQWFSFWDRNRKSASELTAFTDQQIDKAAQTIYGERWISRWTLETVLKYLLNPKT